MGWQTVPALGLIVGLMTAGGVARWALITGVEGKPRVPGKDYYTKGLEYRDKLIAERT